ncbi:MAG: thrombospondin type 3 repeat-containing protein [Pseudomonadota bacterium]|nr:thrombospondin type 3 repeat-containing protein [Pseudomonadota bacterium]
MRLCGPVLLLWLGLLFNGTVHAEVCVDGDVDGVCDDLDDCPYTELSAFVGANGCALDGDADGDGIADQSDRCPYSPQAAIVNAQGCAADSDRDGVPDGPDRCPATPSGMSVDEHGCQASRASSSSSAPAAEASSPDKQADEGPGDSVTDFDPTSDSPPPAVLPMRIDGYLRNSSNIPSEAMHRLADTVDVVTRRLEREPELSITVTGYADARDEASLVHALSENRAALLRAALGAKGVPMSRIYAVSGGASTQGASALIEWTQR